MVELNKNKTCATRMIIERKKESLENERKRNRINYREKGITLIALVVTIIILLILAGVTVSLVVGQNGLVQRAQTASNTMANATANEIIQMEQYASDIDELTAGFIARGESQQGETSLTALQITKITNKIMTTTSEPLTVDYTPSAVETTVQIPGVNNGGLSNQTFSQSSIGATGDGKVSWYVLSADENGVNLVSSPTKQTVQFKDADGYDNCLYYLNEIATNLFANPDAGVTADMVHAFRLSDIKEAAIRANEWSESYWTTNFINVARKSPAVSQIGDERTYLSENTPYTKYPRIYKEKNGVVIANNPMYDEATVGEGIPISNDRIGSTEAATSLTVYGTCFGYYDGDAEDKGLSNQMFRLSGFGNSGVAKNLFNSSGTNYWLATRDVYADNANVNFHLRYVNSGCLASNNLAGSGAYVLYPSYALRVVVSVPGSKVNIDDDGTVTLK